MEDFINAVPIFTNEKGEPYRLFVQDCPEREKIKDMIEYGFGTVESGPGGENTVVLAAPGFNTNGREVFSIYYITDCCKRNKKLNIKDFRLNKRSKYTPDFNPMDVLEGVVTWSQAEKFRKKSALQFRQPNLPIEKSISYHGGNNNNNNNNNENDFRNVETGFTKRSWLTNTDSVMLSTVMSNNGNEGNAHEENSLHLSNQRNSLTDTSPVISIVRNNENTNDDFNEGDSLQLRRQRKYTRAEQEEIVKYVVRHRAYDLVKGTDFWKMMEQYMVCKKRKWQSMKEQFLKKILPDIESYNLSDSQITMFKNVRQTVKQRNKKKEVNMPEESPNDEIDVRTDDVSESKQKRKEHEKEGFQRNTNYYKETEDKALLNFIVERRKYYQIGGVLLWRLMERKQVVPGRSWQSMKERYRKVLVNKLNHYFPEEVVQKFRKGELMGAKKETKKKKKRTNVPQCAPQCTSAKSKPCPNHCTCCFTDSENTNTFSYSSVATSTANNVELAVLNKRVQKRKLFFQNSGILEFTPMSEAGKSVQSRSVLPKTKYNSNEIQKAHSKSKNKDDSVVTENLAQLPEKPVEISVAEPFEFSKLSVQLNEIQNTVVMSLPARDSEIPCSENMPQRTVPENSDLPLSTETSTEVTAKVRRKIVNETKINNTSDKTNTCPDSKTEENVLRELRICLTRCDFLAPLNHNSAESISNWSSQTNTVPGGVTEIEMNALPGHSDTVPERLIMNEDSREPSKGSISELHTSGDSEDVGVPNMEDIEFDESLKCNETKLPNSTEISTHLGSSHDKSKKMESVKDNTYEEKSLLDFITKEGIWLDERTDLSNVNVVKSFISHSDAHGEDTEISIELDSPQKQSLEISLLESSLVESGDNVVSGSDNGGYDNRDKEKCTKSHTEEKKSQLSSSIINEFNGSKKTADVNDSKTGSLSQRMACERKEVPMGEMSIKGIVHEHIENILEKDSIALILEKEEQTGTSSTNLQDSKVSERQELYRRKKGKNISVKKIRKKLCTNKFKIKTVNGKKYKIQNYNGKYHQRRLFRNNNDVEDKTSSTTENKDTCALNQNFVKSVYAHRLTKKLSNRKYKKTFLKYVRSRKEYFPNKSVLHAKQRLVNEKSFIGNCIDIDTLSSTSSSDLNICKRSEGTSSELVHEETANEEDISDLEQLSRNVHNTEAKSHSQNSVYSSDKELLNASSISLNNENDKTDEKIEYNVQLHNIKTKEIDHLGHLKTLVKGISYDTVEERDSERNLSFRDENNDSSFESVQGTNKETSEKRIAMDFNCLDTSLVRKISTGKRVLSTVHNNHRIIDKNVLGSILSESGNKETLCSQNETKGKCNANSESTLNESNFKSFPTEEDNISRNKNQQNSKKFAKTESSYFMSKRHGERTPTKQKTNGKNGLRNIRKTGFKRSTVSVYRRIAPLPKLNLNIQRRSKPQTCNTNNDIDLDNCTAYSDKEETFHASSSTVISTSSSTIISTAEQLNSDENSVEKNLDALHKQHFSSSRNSPQTIINGVTPQLITDSKLTEQSFSSENLDNFNTTELDYSSELNEQISDFQSYVCGSSEHSSGINVSQLSKSTELTLSNAVEISYESDASKQLKSKKFRKDTNCLLCSDRQCMDPKVDDVFCDEECFCES